MNEEHGNKTLEQYVRESVGSRLAAMATGRSRSTPMVKGEDGSWRPMAYGPSCPDGCGIECPLHGKRNAKLARRAARARGAHTE